MTRTDGTTATDGTPDPGTVADVPSRLIDQWFPCSAVDAAVLTPAGSGRSEKAIFPWFASRPIAQARAAVLTTLLPADDRLKPLVEQAVAGTSRTALADLAEVIQDNYQGRTPVVLDLFSGRGIIPLEAARLGVTAVGTDLSPVATLAGRLLADWPLRNWDSEPPVPYAAPNTDGLLEVGEEARLVRDARLVHTAIGERLEAALEKYYPRNPDGRFPWGYLWTVTMPCDQCHRRFPLVGSLVLRHPYTRTHDAGQSMRLSVDGDRWSVEVVDGPAAGEVTYSSATGKKGKSARCLFCGHVHGLESVKAVGIAGQYRDEPLVVADIGSEDSTKKIFRSLRDDERSVIEAADPSSLPPAGRLSAVPDEPIPPVNGHTVRASRYGYMNFGDLMCPRQTLHVGTVAAEIRTCYDELVQAGCSPDYATALTSLAAATLMRMLKHATRGARLRAHGKPDGTGQNRVQIDHIFSNEASLAFQFDYFEAGIGDGPGTWLGLVETGLNPLAAHLRGLSGTPAKLRRANAMALPFRDASVDAVICDPPYYDMIEYADASDYFYVWLRRALIGAQPDLFEHEIGTTVSPNLQNKDDEIIVRRFYNGGVRHDRSFYEHSLSRAFQEARRVLREDGHLVVVFGHSDPEAWKRLLGALHAAGFIVTSSWPSRTETSNTGVASIKVTVTIGCRVAPAVRPVTTASVVDREVSEAVKAAARGWDRDGLALTDQLMAAYGPAMEVYGRYDTILQPSGEQVDLDRYLTLARTAVRDATALKLDELPLETFDAATRFAVFWHRLYSRGDVPKGEARFLAQADNLRIEDLRGPLLTESKSGFKLRFDEPEHVNERSSTFQVVRAMAAAWDRGATEAVATVIALAERQPTDAHLWAVVGELIRQLPPSDSVAKALTAIQRNAGTIGTLVQRVVVTERASTDQLSLSFTTEEPRS